MSDSATPAGWYGDPTPGAPPGSQRWWDGTRWTEQTQAIALPPPPAPGQHMLTPPPPAPSRDRSTGQETSWTPSQSAERGPQGPQGASSGFDLARQLRSNTALTVAAGGFALCLISLVLPWATADVLFAAGEMRATAGASMGVLVGSALGGFGIYRAMLGDGNAIFAAAAGSALNLIVALVNVADVETVSNQSFGAVTIGIGLVALLLGSLLGGGGSVAHHVSSNKSEL